MSDKIPSSPIPSLAASNENTCLLSTSAVNYNTQEARQERTVITMSTSSDHQESSSGSSNLQYLNGSSGGATFSKHYHKIVSAGQPTLPTHQLTEKIQDNLIFGEIKKNQQARAIREQKKKKYGKDQEVPAIQDSSSISSDSDGIDDDSASVHRTLKKKLSEWSIGESEDGKRLRKRDFAVDALKFATDNWKAKHGYASGSSSSLFSSSMGKQQQDNNAIITTIISVTSALLNSNANGNGVGNTAAVVQELQKTKLDKSISSSAESVFGVAKNASVCAVLALLHEHRQSSGHSAETDISLQALALSTLNLGLKVHDTSVSQVVLYEMLTNKWIQGKSALEFAVENNSELILNDTRVQIVIEELWNSGPNWRHDPNHPSYIWLNSPSSTSSSTANGNGVKHHQKLEEPKNFAWFVITRTVANFLARWPNARYQALIASFSALVYLAFHLATIANLDYTSDTPYAYEYIYYFFVVSDFFSEFYKLCTQPTVYLKKISSYINVLTASLLLAAFVIRFVALIAIESIEEEVYLISFSFNLLILATPLMFFRAFAASTDLCWSTAKTSYILRECLKNSAWVFSLGLFVVVGFWIALGALQYEDVHPFSMLSLLVLGALHAPEIGSTLLYQPEIAGFLMAVYLFFTVIVFSALLTASFLSTILQIYGRIDIVKRDWIINRCLRSNPRLNIFPSILLDLIFKFFAWIGRIIFRREGRIVWLEKVHQVFWYIIYSPIILLVALFELVSTFLFRWKLVVNAFKRHPTNPASTSTVG